MTVDVQTYGAVGDGTTDDTAAITAALNAVTGVLYFPAGTYRTTAPLTARSNRVPILGDGPQCTALKPELQPGQYALTLGWDSTEAPVFGPITALSGLSIQGPAGNGLRLHGEKASSLTVRDVALSGFDVQLELGDNAYLASFERCGFHSPGQYGVRLAAGAYNAGENIAFRGCVWSGGNGTGVYLGNSGSSLSFDACSFDYIARAVWQRAGATAFGRCHFETDGAGAEYLLLDREGYVSLPMMTLTDCDIYPLPGTYDTFVRLLGDHGDQGLRIVNPYVGLAPGSCPYLVRDDGPWRSSIVVSGAWYGRGDLPKSLLRRQDGTEVVLEPGVMHVV